MDIITVMTGLRENEAAVQSVSAYDPAADERYAGDGLDEFEDVLNASYRKDIGCEASVKDNPAADNGPEEALIKEISEGEKTEDISENRPENEQICIKAAKEAVKEMMLIPVMAQIAGKLKAIFVSDSNILDITGLAAEVKKALGKKVMDKVLKEMDEVFPEWKNMGPSAKNFKDPKMAELVPIFVRVAQNVLDSLKPEKSGNINMIAGTRTLAAENRSVKGNMAGRAEDHKNPSELLIEKTAGEFIDDLCLNLARAIKPDSNINASMPGSRGEKVLVKAPIIAAEDISMSAVQKDQVNLSGPDKNKGGPERQIDGIFRPAETSILKAGRANLSAGPAANIKPQEIALQITRHIDSDIGDRVKEIEVRLSPESLGTIKIRVLSQDNKVDIFIKTHYSHTNEIINESIDSLRNNLIEKGLEIKELSVSADPNDFNGRDNGKNFQAYRRGRSAGGWIRENDAAEDKMREAAFLRESYEGSAAENGYLNIIV